MKHHTTRPRDHRHAFTLVELIAVIVVLAILAGVAVPKYFQYAARARAAAVEGSLKVMQRALLAYNRDTGAWPPDVQPRTAPAGLNPYMDINVWTQLTPVGTVWDYENWSSPQWSWPTPVVGITIRSGNGGALTSDATEAIGLVEQHIDDANTQTGNLRTYSHGYFFKVADQ